MARIEKTIDVEVPVRTAYNQCTQFKDFPRFIDAVRQVERLDDTRLRVHASVAGQKKAAEVHITYQVPDRIIAWRGPNGATGQVSFKPIHATGTRIALDIEYQPEGLLESVGDVLGMASQRVESELGRFKAFIESRGTETGEWRGEVRQGQPSDGSGGEPESVLSVGAGTTAGLGSDDSLGTGDTTGSGGSPVRGAYDKFAGRGEASPPLPREPGRGAA